MKTNNYSTTFAAPAVLLLVLFFSVSAAAQRKKAPTVRKTPAPVVTTNALEMKQTAEKTAIQLKNVTNFIYKLGGIATGIEDLDKEAKAGKLSRAQLDKNAQYKQAVIQSIVNLKAGLAALEIEFRTKPSVKNYLVQVQGVTDLATQSEELARAGRFTDSGKVLITVVEKLADALVAMP